MTPRWLILIVACLGVLTACSNYGGSTSSQNGHGASGITVFGDVDAAVTRTR